MSTIKGSYTLGKLSRNCDKSAPRNCEARLTWELRDQGDGKLEFSACGEVWNHLKTDIYMGGQCVDTLAALFPRDKIAQRIRQTWEKYHLNGMNAGTPEQRRALESGRAALVEKLRANGTEEGQHSDLFYLDGKPNWFAIARHLGKDSSYSIDCEILREAGLYKVPITAELRAAALGGLPDDAKVYRYGTRWLHYAIPADVIALIKNNFRELADIGEDMGRDEEGEADSDMIADLGLTIRAEFVPFSQSRNKGNKHHSLNWRVTLQCKGRDVLTCDYSAGSAHCPADKKRWPTPHDKRQAIADECESGREAPHKYRKSKKIEPDARDVINSLLLDASALDCASFADWCSDYGYDADSLSARKIYDECIAHAVAFRAAVGAENFEKLRDAVR